MINGKRILALIPARGGSKGIKNKNIIDVCGKPLIAYTITETNKSRYLDDVVVTTDSEEIKRIAEKYGADVPFLRPKELAGDRSTSLEAVLHAIKELKHLGREYEILVLLQPTSPLRTTEDIDRALRLFIDKGETGVVSISEVTDSPVLMRRLTEGNRLIKLSEGCSTVRRQDMQRIYRVNGSIYINRLAEVDEGLSFNDNPVGFVMEKSHSVDVDEYSDLAMVKYYLSSKG